MGIRFRKSVKLGSGTRLNLSKSGVGFSFGAKGMRISKKADGGTRSTLSVPGTGISYVSETNGTSQSTSDAGTGHTGKERNPKGTGKTIIASLVLMMMVGGCISSQQDKPIEGTSSSSIVETIVEDESSSSVEESSSSEVMEDSSSKSEVSKPFEQPAAPAMTSQPEEQSTPTIEPPPKQQEPEPETEVSSQLPEQPKQPSENTPQQPAPSGNGTATNNNTQPAATGQVYITATGSKYHKKPNCGSTKNATAIDLNKAIAQGYEPCKKCY